MRVVYGRDGKAAQPRPARVFVPEYGLSGLKGGVAGLLRSAGSLPGDDSGNSKEIERMLKL